MALAALSAVCPQGDAQAALLMEEPYGFFGALNTTGHDAVYFERICAATPIKLRRCAAGEPGTVFTRYQGIAGYDWVAMPLIPYLYSVENPSEVPSRVDRKTVIGLREQYHAAHLRSLGEEVRRAAPFKGDGTNWWAWPTSGACTRFGLRPPRSRTTRSSPA
jgi:hypothetical protein